VGDDFLEFVGDDEHGRAAGGQRANRREEGVDLGRREDRRRLVEDQDGRIAREFAQQFDALRDPDRKAFDGGLGIDREAVFMREAFDFGASRGAIELRATLWFAPENDVFPDAQAIDELEMLVNEPDVAASEHRPRGRFQLAGGDRRQRRLAGPVFTA